MSTITEDDTELRDLVAKVLGNTVPVLFFTSKTLKKT
jgi:hypothetical protein